MTLVLIQIVSTGRVVHADPDTARAWIAQGYAVELAPIRLYGADTVETR